MLAKPYEKIYSLDNNNYYFLEVNNILYLAIESVLPYTQKGKSKELQQGLKILPIYSPILYLLTQLARLEPIDTKEVEGLGKEDIYDTLDISEVRKTIQGKIEEVHDESMFEFGSSIKSNIVKKLIEENGFELLMKMNYDTFRSSYWVAKTDQYGKLTLHDITTGGRQTDKVMTMSTFFLDVKLAGIILIAYNDMMIKRMKRQQKMLKKQLKKQNKNKKMEENKQ